MEDGPVKSGLELINGGLGDVVGDLFGMFGP